MIRPASPAGAFGSRVTRIEDTADAPGRLAARCLFQQSFFRGPDAGFGTRAGAHLQEDTSDVFVDRVRADGQLNGELLVRHAFRHQSENGALAEGQTIGSSPL